MNAPDRENSLTVTRSFTKGQPLIIYNIALCATMGGFLLGYDTGIMNGANLLIREEFRLGDHWTAKIVSSSFGAAAFFSILAGVVSDSIGRKATIMLSAVVFTIGGVFMGVAGNPRMLLAGRITVGAAMGMVSSVVPVYVSECAPPNIRGCLITLYQLFITLGIWLSSVSAIAFYSVPNGWRYMLGLSAIPGIFQFMFFLGLPESPRYQVKKNNIAKARHTLQRIRQLSNVTDELQEIMVSLEKERSESGGCNLLRRMLFIHHVRYALFIGCMLQVFQQFSGINSVIYYSSSILKSSGFNVKLSIYLSLIPFSVNFLATFIGLWAVEALGRTRALAASFSGIAVALLMLVVAFIPEYLTPHRTDIQNEQGFTITWPCTKYKDCWHCTRDDKCAFCSIRYGHSYVRNGSCVPAASGSDFEHYASAGRCSAERIKEEDDGIKSMVYAYDYCPSNFGWLAVAGLILFVLGFAPGAGPLPWTINAEIYPLWCRSTANSIATLTNWTCNFLIAEMFLTVTKTFTVWGTFLMFVPVCFVASIFVLFLVPETSNCNLEQIEQLFMSEAELDELRARLRETPEAEKSNKAMSKPMGPVDVTWATKL